MTTHPFPSPSPSPSPPTDTPPSLSLIYSAFHIHPFPTDPEWQSGLSSILGHPSTPATQAELDAQPGLILNAKLFYFSRKHNLPAIDAAGYVDWLRQQTQAQIQPQLHPLITPRPSHETTATQSSEPTHIAAQPLATPSSIDPSPTPPHPSIATLTTTTTTAGPTTLDPPYPTSFAAIIDLITNNKPIPGIEEIPTTVLEPGSSKIDRTPRRRKPWEKDDLATTTTADTNTTTNPTTAVSSPSPSPVATPSTTHLSQLAEIASAADGNAGTSSTQHPSAGSSSATFNANSINGPLSTGEGIVKILQPNAIPPSGLLAGD